ncbi:hypothetical protein H6F74_16835 [Trichocoleus sp. FACHB-90]|nr:MULTISPECIES: hypothetical protein [unclassified Trichocoleus]MBD1927896.1 hypothetical protein [Trichocoleus sp. FACHB-90]MBD1935249.1 hypothetical protein [Trichocoleus sp. FACHB-69]
MSSASVLSWHQGELRPTVRILASQKEVNYSDRSILIKSFNLAQFT